MAGGLSLDERLARFAAARQACEGLDGELWRAGGVELAGVMTSIDAMVVAGESARVVVAREAMGRGETGSGVLALTPVQWVRRHAPSLRGGGAGQVVAVAEAFAVAGNAPVKAAVLSGVLPVRSAAVVVAEADRLRPLLAQGAEPAVLDGLVSMAVQHGARGCRMVRPGLLARYGLDGQLQGEQDVAKRFVALSQPRVDELGLAEYRLTVDVEGRAVLEAALGPLSAPRPVEGERDLRSSDRRRGEALVALVRRAVAAGDGTPTNPKSQVFVTVDSRRCAAGFGAPASRWVGRMRVPFWLRRPFVGWRVTPRSSPPSWAARVRCSTSVARSACSPARRFAGSGFGMGAVPSRGATCLRSGRMRITWCIGRTAVAPGSTTGHCCANATTRSSTRVGSRVGWSTTAGVPMSSGT